MLVFKLHPVIDGMFLARHNNCTVIYGCLIDGYEVQDAEGECHKNLTLAQAEELVSCSPS